ncbi:MAG: glycosyltransferase family 2 protein [Alphaproteobacteria bacterium]|nr:glycosyltransferase family 2 protein [Alphaproteobacteria bacterium]HPF47385.1 glycosyltransferase [Emcibacteraceae bacterium]
MNKDDATAVNSMVNNAGVVIIGRNEGQRLNACITSVLRSGAKHIVYVDSCSSDGSAELAKSFKIDVIELDGQFPLTAARARNAGFKFLDETVEGLKYVHFIDGDCEMDENWLGSAITAFDVSPDVAVICGRLREKYREKSLYNRLCDMAWYIKPGEINSCGGIATIRADIFQKHNGFNTNLIAGEEPEFYHRLRKAGQRILCLDAPMGFHDAAMMHYKAWWIRSLRTGFSYANAAEWGRWAKERKSFVIWGGIYPLILIIMFLQFWLAGLLFLALFPIQIVKIYFGLNMPYSSGDRLLYATFCMLDKIPEFLGFLKYHYVKISGSKQKIIEYK